MIVSADWYCASKPMTRKKILLILADAADAAAVQAMLANARDGPFDFECRNRCSDGIETLESAGAGAFAGVVVDLFLPDSQGIGTFDSLLRASPQVPILLICRTRNEDLGRQAVRHGAQDYLLVEQLDARSLQKALSNMFKRSAISEALRRASQDAPDMLHAIRDAVVSTDVSGNVTYLNPVAECITDWSLQEAAAGRCRRY